MSAAAASAGGDGGEDEARKNDDRKRKEAERSRRRRADKKAKDEAESKKMKGMEVYVAELEKSLESNSVAIAAAAASNQRLLAENTVLKNNPDQARIQSLEAENQRLLAENTVLRNLVLKKNTDQIIWDEVGDDQFEREKVLLDLEQECLEVYRRKVDSVNISRARRHPKLAESEAEFTHLILSLGVDPWMGNASPSRYCVDNLVEPNGLTL